VPLLRVAVERSVRVLLEVANVAVMRLVREATEKQNLDIVTQLRRRNCVEGQVGRQISNFRLLLLEAWTEP